MKRKRRRPPPSKTATKPRLKQVAAGIGATVGVLASLVGVLSYIDQRRADPPPPARKSLSISRIALHDSAEPLGDFLRKTPNSRGRSYTRAERQHRGYSFLLEVRARGPVGTRLRLRWRLRFDAGDPVPGLDYDQIASDFKTSALDQSAEVPVWVPDPLVPGSYVVRFTFQALDASGHVVAFARERDSEPFEHALS
jgi:hypothetical protein